MADYPLTISRTKVSVENNPERLNGFTNKYSVLYSDINTTSATASTDTVTLTLGATPTFWAVTGAAVNVTTAFAGTGGFAVALGITGTAANIMASQSVLAKGFLQPSNGAGTVATPTTTTSTASTSLKAVFTNSVGSSPSSLTAGALDIHLKILDLSRLS